MKFDLPPLSSLRAFEAAARKLSFTRASEELHLTQAAVSFQVRRLEEDLGVQLFIRKQRTLELTPEGQSLMKAVQSAFLRLHTEKAALTAKSASKTVTISLPISLSGKWLVPRLHLLHAQCPHLHLRVDASDRLVDFHHEDVQLAVRYCARPPGELNAALLFTDRVFPVCTPAIAARIGEARDPARILDETLLHDRMWDYTWDDWLESCGLDRRGDRVEFHFSHSGNAIDAAIAGQGIALGRLPLVADDLVAGRLVRPFPLVGQSSYAYHVIWPKRSDANPLVATVIDWLIAQARTTGQVIL